MPSMPSVGDAHDVDAPAESTIGPYETELLSGFSRLVAAELLSGFSRLVAFGVCG